MLCFLRILSCVLAIPILFTDACQFIQQPFSKNLLTKQMESVDCEDSHQHLLPELSMDQPLAQPEVLRDAERLGND